LDEYGRVGVAIYDDEVGLAKDATLATVSSKLDKLDELGRLEPVDYTTTPLAANGHVGFEPPTAAPTRASSAVPCTPTSLGPCTWSRAPTAQTGTSWTATAVSAGTGLKFSVEKVLPYARVRYVNGATAQTVFRLYVYRRLRI
jgi:hypothetical protein